MDNYLSGDGPRNILLIFTELGKIGRERLRQYVYRRAHGTDYDFIRTFSVDALRLDPAVLPGQRFMTEFTNNV